MPYERTPLRARLRSAGMILTVAAIAVGVLGAHLFWYRGTRAKAPAVASVAPETQGTPFAPRPARTSSAAHATAAARPVAVARVPSRGSASASNAARAVANPSARSSSAARAASRSTPAAAPSASLANALGPLYRDDNNGYSMRFPAEWSMHTFSGDPWVLESTDGHAVISVGFSPFPPDYTGQTMPPQWVAQRIQRRPRTVLNGQGYAQIAGRKALWSKSTGPLRLARSAPRMTRVSYILPLPDGRIVELRIAAAPEQFTRMFPIMKLAVRSFALTNSASDESVALTR